MDGVGTGARRRNYLPLEGVAAAAGHSGRERACLRSYRFAFGFGRATNDSCHAQPMLTQVSLVHDKVHLHCLSWVKEGV